jgi:hypothetical protein
MVPQRLQDPGTCIVPEKRLGSIRSFTFSIDTSRKAFEQSKKVEDVQYSAGCHQRIRVPRISRIKIPEGDGEPEASPDLPQYSNRSVGMMLSRIANPGVADVPLPVTRP